PVPRLSGVLPAADLRLAGPVLSAAGAARAGRRRPLHLLGPVRRAHRRPVTTADQSAGRQLSAALRTVVVARPAATTVSASWSITDGVASKRCAAISLSAASRQAALGCGVASQRPAASSRLPTS